MTNWCTRKHHSFIHIIYNARWDWRRYTIFRIDKILGCTSTFMCICSPKLSKLWTKRHHGNWSCKIRRDKAIKNDAFNTLCSGHRVSLVVIYFCSYFSLNARYLFQMSSSEHISSTSFPMDEILERCLWCDSFFVHGCVCAPIILFSSNIFFVMMVFFPDEFISCCFYKLLKFFVWLPELQFLWLFFSKCFVQWRQLGELETILINTHFSDLFIVRYLLKMQCVFW